MALNKVALKNQLKGHAANMARRTSDQEAGWDAWAEGMADIIDAYVRTITVTGTVATTGSAAAQTGTIVTAVIS
jgi:hypothetical protein